MPFFAVESERKCGVFASWDKCCNFAKEFDVIKIAKFSSQSEALNYLKRVEQNIGCVDGLDNKVDSETTAQKLTVLEGKVAALEHRVDVVETVIFPKEDDTYPIVSCSSEKSTTGLSNQNSLRSRLHQTGLEAKPIGARKFASCHSQKRSIEEFEFGHEPPKKLAGVSYSSFEGVEKVETYSVPFKCDPTGYVEVYTDGACSKNGKAGAKAGIGVWFNDDHPLNFSGPVNGRPTNNTAEIQAAITAVKRAIHAGIKKLSILTDSQFMINCMTLWIGKWRKNSWTTNTGDPVKNKEDLLTLDNLCRDTKISVKWTYVKGHDGCHGNEAADELARKGVSEYKIVGVPTLLP